MNKYKSVIEKVTITDATFKDSSQNEFVPSWINYFYGNNGTGKSTIARTLKSLTDDDYVMRVFGRDFMEEVSLADDDASMPGVLTLGKEYINVQDQIEAKIAEQDKLAAKLTLADEELIKTSKTKSAIKKKFEDKLWTAKGQELKKVFGGGGAFRSKEAFANNVKAAKPVKHNINDIKTRFKTASDASISPYSSFLTLDLSKLDEAENFSLLAEPIISTADSQFSRFMQAIDAVSWVEQGLKQYAPKAEGKCPYCQQSLKGLTKNIEAQITQCFDGKYSEDNATLAKYQQRYASYTEAFVDTVNQYADFLRATPNFGKLSECEKNLAQLEKTISENKQRIAAKVAKPSEAIKLDSLRPYLEAINLYIAETNTVIIKHNEICSHRGEESITCLSEVIELAAFDMQETVRQFIMEDKAFEDSIATQATYGADTQAALIDIKEEINNLTKKLGGSVATLQKVNDLLIKTGFRGFSLEHESGSDSYRIIRDDGSVATKLSEGERNFIAFLYFYYLVQGSWKPEELIKRKIVVIDDPVSSMDSGVLSIVGSLVRDLIDDCFFDGERYKIAQIFILTHNPYFHNAVSHKMLRPEEKYFKKIAFFEVKKSDDNISSVSKPCVQQNLSKDPDIDEENVSPVQNSYTALWEDYKTSRRESTLLHAIHRIIETHFVLLCSYERDYLQNQVLNAVGGDVRMQKLVKDILQNIHDNAIVEDSVGEMVYFPASKTIDDYKEAFKIVFKTMGQEQHYAKMSGECF